MLIAPAIEYFAVTIEGKQAGQLARMKAARIFDPRFVGRLGYDLGEDAVDALDKFKFYTHPELYPKIQSWLRYGYRDFLDSLRGRP